MRKPEFRIKPNENGDGWQWECTYCWPPARGARYGPDAYRRIIRTSLPGHYERRRYHHEHMARKWRTRLVAPRRAIRLR